MRGSATISACGRYRYRLERRWAGKPGDRDAVAFVGLNPSTADAETDDPTLRRCVGFARDWGFPAVVLVNVFALRATDPRVLSGAVDPVGPENDGVLRAVLSNAPMAVAAWGARAPEGRVATVAALRGDWRCVRVLAGGAPGHPLYVPRGALPAAWAPRAD